MKIAIFTDDRDERTAQASTGHRGQASEARGYARRRKPPSRSDMVAVREPPFHLATRPLLPQHDGAAPIETHDWNEFLPMSMPTKAIGCLRASAIAGSLSLVPAQASLAGAAGPRPDHPINGHWLARERLPAPDEWWAIVRHPQFSCQRLDPWPSLGQRCISDQPRCRPDPEGR
jgi:hypothetical protein